MSIALHTFLSTLLKFGAVAVILNEVRGLILAGPVIYGLYQSGGTAVAIWIAFCSLVAIVLSVVIPMFAIKKANAYMDKRVAAATS